MITEMAKKENPAGNRDLDGQDRLDYIVPKWTNIRKITDFWFLKIPSVWLCRSFQKVNKALFLSFSGVFFMYLSARLHIE